MDFSERKADALVLMSVTPAFEDQIASQLGRRNLQDDETAESEGEPAEAAVVEVETEEDDELTTLRALMKKFIVIKNKQLDLMCGKVTSYGTQTKVTSPRLELIVTKIATSSKSSPPTIIFTYTYDGTASRIPTDELVKQTMDLNGDVTEICVQ